VTQTVLVAGAGLAGSRVAEGLRFLGFEGRIMLAGDEPHQPYERPTLSKELLAGERADASLRSRAHWAEQRIELLTQHTVSHVDPIGRTALVGGDLVAWDSLVVATGACPRRLDGPAGVHHLRSLDDAHALAADVDGTKRVVVVGAGFIGAEVASTLLPRAASMTIVEPLEAPLVRVLGPDVGSLLARRYRAHGVDLRLGVGVERFHGDEHVSGVVLTDRSVLPADVVVVGIGAVPASPFGGAIDVDECGCSAVAEIYACGDVAAWWRPSLRRRLRVEHWTSAAGQARAVAAAIMGAREPYDEPQYFWSDQFGLRLQHVGHAEEWHAVVFDGDEDAFTARYVDRDGRLLAALAVNQARAVAGLRRELAA
jgi:3-phenylpropionate/trans-cinnamate dioxygenase ferredoxin reductase subunit